MSSSVSPEMNFFRWILSHLTIIVVLFVILYFYWNHYGSSSDELVEPAAKSLIESPEHVSKKQRINKEHSDNISQPVLDHNTIVEKKSMDFQNTASSHSSGDFSKRMEEYKQRLSAEEQNVMNNAAGTFQQGSEKTFKYPTDDIKPVEKNDNVDEVMSFAPAAVTVKETVSSQPISDLQDEEIKRVHIRKADTVDKTQAEAKVVEQAEKQKKSLNVDDKKLQQQIRDRQKQLQDQMILLIPLDSEKKTSTTIIKSTKIESIKPLINTPEQKELLNDARHAFELHDFKEAEKKYLQLIKQLPELPDVVGELANVYKTQKKIPDYLVTNTQFVKRLIDHNRFSEAWSVVAVTDKVDKKAANKQRRIINNKQKELQ
ncbi:MAG: hypothetical protein DRQ43_06025 [Gammaproteobacteria bacterium]|nr:MAG: hypothetical protein DRQ43_06025 [Gammaproteobacteria bacterium]